MFAYSCIIHFGCFSPGMPHSNLSVHPNSQLYIAKNSSHVYIKCRNFSLESGLGIESQRCVRLYLRDLHCLPIELKINWIGYRICSSCTLPCVKKHPRAKPYHCISHNDTSSNLDKTWCQQNAATHSIFKVKDCEHPMFAY